MAAGAAIVLIASHTGAASQALDPGWQIVYAGQPGYDSDGLINSIFGDGSGQPIVARAYQPPVPIYPPESGPAAEPAAQQGAPISYQQPAPASYQAAPPQQARTHRPAPAYYQQAPAQQARATEQGPVYYLATPVPLPAAQPVPVTRWQGASQSQAPARPDPRYSGPPPGRSRARLSICACELSDRGCSAAIRSDTPRLRPDRRSVALGLRRRTIKLPPRRSRLPILDTPDRCLDSRYVAPGLRRRIIKLRPRRSGNLILNTRVGARAAGPGSVVRELSGGSRAPTRRISAAR